MCKNGPPVEDHSKQMGKRFSFLWLLLGIQLSKGGTVGNYTVGSGTGFSSPPPQWAWPDQDPTGLKSTCAKVIYSGSDQDSAILILYKEYFDSHWLQKWHISPFPKQDDLCNVLAKHLHSSYTHSFIGWPRKLLGWVEGNVTVWVKLST